MKFVYEAPKGRRLKRYGVGVTTFSKNLWWCLKDKKWKRQEECKDWYSTTAPCRTVRAFRRMLRKNPILHGEVIWLNRYVGFDVTCIRRKEKE